MEQFVARRPTATPSSDVVAKPRLRPPSIPAVVFVVLAVVVPIALQKPLLNSDGDLARHLRHGRYMLEHGALIRSDPFSFTRPGAPFLGFEYGSQLLYALAERVGGLPAVAILAGLLIALTYGLLTAFLLRRGVDPLLAYLVVGLAVVLGIGHWNARPHLFSFVATVILLGLLEGKQQRALLKCALLFAVWANLHGGFVYGWILIGLYLAGSLGELWWGSDQEFWRERSRHYFAMLVVAVASTVLNPHGLELHRHLFGFFGQPFLRDNTAEFVSPNFHESEAKVFLIALLVMFGCLILQGRRPTLPRLMVMGVGAAFGLLAVRNIPLFGLTALPVFALHVDSLWRQMPDPRGVRRRFEGNARLASTWPWVLPVTILLGALALSHGRIRSAQLIGDHFDPTVFPVAAVAKGRAANLDGRLFSDLAWGGYLIYAWPEQRIFIDGGTDFFGEDIFREYVDIKRLSPGWRELLARRGISLMLLDRQTPLAHELARDGRWGVWYCDSLAVMFHRSSDQFAVTPEREDSSERELDHCAERSPETSATATSDNPQGRVTWRSSSASPVSSPASASLITRGAGLASERGGLELDRWRSRWTHTTGKSVVFQ
jgi:hypothetical protein